MDSDYYSPHVFTYRCELTSNSKSTCRDLLSITHAFPTLLDTQFPLDDNVLDILKILSMTGNSLLPEQCLDILLHLLCIVITPPCGSDTGLPVLICEGNCKLYNQIREAGICDAIENFLAQVTMLSDSQDLSTLSRAFTEFDCSNPATYFFTTITDQDSTLCIKIFSPDTEGMS